MKKTFLSDFDGFITNVDAEAEGFRQVYPDLLAQAIHFHPATVQAALNHQVEDILRQPEQHAWISNGFAVAPSTADSYVLYTRAARLFLAELDVMWTEEAKDKLLYQLFEEAYSHTHVVFKDGAKAFLEAMNRLTNFHIVTNSNPDKVAKKIAHLGVDPDAFSIFGSAKKFVADAHQPDSLPFQVELPGFPRPVILRRPNYYSIIETLKPDYVGGDIYELDLSIADYLGIGIVLMANPTSVPWESAYVAAHPKGLVVKNLQEVLDFLAV